MAPSPREALREHIRGTLMLSSIHSVLYFDQNTQMPPAAAEWRGDQMALLAAQLHERQSSPGYADLVGAAAEEMGEGATPQERRNLELLQGELRRQQRLDPSLVERLARAQARGYALWQQARSRADFASFAPALEELLTLRREQARQLDEPRTVWETLAQPFEPDVCEARIEELFTPLRQRLPALLERVKGSDLGPRGATGWDLAEEQQDRLCRELLEHWGFDPARCQTARSPHPFSCTLGPADFRITTRVVAGQPLAAFLATAHEWGHSLYEQGLPRSSEHWFPWPLGEATSMGVHESQSLFWECRVARSEAFARRWEPRFSALGGREAWGPEPHDAGHGFWRALNPLRPGPIRVEADELSYCLHIVLRWELERRLLEGDLAVAELPAAWNRRMVELLGVEPASDAQGCLQDVHWSEGLFGYFPSYALGHLIAAQLGQAMEKELGPIEARIGAGREEDLRRWLADHVYPHGRSVNGEELVELATGAPLSAEPFLTYLEEKVERLLA